MAKTIRIANLATPSRKRPVVVEDLALKSVRVGDVLERNGRHREAAAVYRRAARAFESDRRLSHARATWRLVLRALPEDSEARARIIELGGMPTAPDRRVGFSTQVLQLDPSEVEGTVVGDEMYEITDPGFLDENPADHEDTSPGNPQLAARPARRAPIGFVGGTSSSVGAMLDEAEFTVPSEQTES